MIHRLDDPDQQLGDERLNRLDQEPSCFVCARRVVAAERGVYVSSPKAGNLKLAAHRDCVNGMDAVEVAARYQRGLWAALGGAKELS